MYQRKFEIMGYGKTKYYFTSQNFERLIKYIGNLLVMINKWIWYMHDEYYHSSPSFDENLKLPPFARILSLREL